MSYEMLYEILLCYHCNNPLRYTEIKVAMIAGFKPGYDSLVCNYCSQTLQKVAN
jgi:uncharacterized protein YbaR (Trm112 family)